MRRLLAAAVAVVLAGLAAPALAAPGPPSAPEYWFDQWHVQQLWQDGARGQGITIAELDTGVNADLPGLRGKVLPGKDFGTLGGDGRTDRDATAFGHGAPAAIHAARSFCAARGSALLGGIFSSSSAWRTARTSRLFSGWPGTSAGPEAPPCSQPLRESSDRPPFILPAACEWQA